jgi:hypothetical protein
MRPTTPPPGRRRFDRRSAGYGGRVTERRLQDELFVLWSAARAEANAAYAAWCSGPGHDAYAVYRAAEDRADAAESALAVAVTAPAVAA